MSDLFTRLRELFPANRLAAIGGFVAAIIAALASLQTSFVPGSPPAEAIAKAIAFLGSVAAGIAIVLKFLEGAQNFDTLVLTGAPKQPGVTVINNDTGTAGDEADLDMSYVGPDPDQPPNELPAGGHPMDAERVAGFEQSGRQSLGMDPDRPQS